MYVHTLTRCGVCVSAWHAYAEQLSVFSGSGGRVLVGGVATTTRVWGSNPEGAGCFLFEPEINLWWCMDESSTKNVNPPEENNNMKVTCRCVCQILSSYMMYTSHSSTTVHDHMPSYLLNPQV